MTEPQPIPSGHVIVERDGDIAILRLSRPPANAITPDVCRAVDAAYDAILADDRSAAIVLTGQGNFFSGGLDLKAVPTYTAEQQREMILGLNGIIAKLYACEIPVVGAINGHAVAGGFVLALLPDYRVGPAGEYSFGLTEARVGIPFPIGPQTVVQAELAPADVRFYTLLARNFGPEEALKRGVFDELQPPDKLLPRAIEVARDLARAPADAYARIKHQFRAAAIATLQAAVAANHDPILDSWISADAAGASRTVLKGE